MRAGLIRLVAQYILLPLTLLACARPARAQQVPAPAPMGKSAHLVKWLTPATIGLPLVDARVTQLGLHSGLEEANPLMRPLVKHPLAMYSLKAVEGIGLWQLSQHTMKKQPKLTLGVMLLLNGWRAWIIGHNLRLLHGHPNGKDG